MARCSRPEAFVLRYFGGDGDDRLLMVNLGIDLHLDPAPEPLLAPPEGRRWELIWSSEDARYGGCGTYPPDTDENWRIPGHAAIVMRAGRRSRSRGRTNPMLEPVRVMPRAPCASRNRDPHLQRGMAGHQRTRRLRLGHGQRRHHAALSRPADRGAAESARPNDDAQRAFGALRLADGHAVLYRSARAHRPFERRDAAGRRVPAGGRTAGLALRSRGRRVREAAGHALPPEHRLYPLQAARRRGPVRLGLRPAVHFRPHDAPGERRRPVRSTS